MMLSGATRSVGDIWPRKVPGSDKTEAPCSNGAVCLAVAPMSGALCSGTGMTCWLRGVAMGGSFGTPTARPEDAAAGAATGAGAVCASSEGASSASIGRIKITNTAKILRNIWVRDLLELACLNQPEELHTKTKRRPMRFV